MIEEIGPVQAGQTISKLDKFITSDIQPLYKENKKLKSLSKIKSKVNLKYFKVYNEEATLGDAINLGEFNCLTFGMIYAYTFESIGIPLELDGDAVCTFVFPFPDEDLDPIGVDGLEMSDLSNNKEYHETFADLLVTLKVISAEDRLINTSTSLFEKYFDESGRVTPKKILASYYYTLASIKMDQLDGISAYQLGQKSNFLNPTYSTHQILYIIGTWWLDQSDERDMDKVNLLGDLIRYNNKLITADMFKRQVYLTYKSMSDSESPHKAFQPYYDLFKKMSISDSMERELEWFYTEHYAIDLYQRAQLEEGYTFAKKAYTLSNRSLEHQNLFYNRFISSFHAAKTEEWAEESSTLFDTFPELVMNPYFYVVMENLILIEADEHIYDHEYQEAYELLQQFEEFEENNPGEIKPQEYYLSRAFGRLAIYYYGVNNLDRAKNLIESRLEYYPNNRDLKRKRDMIIYNY